MQDTDQADHFHIQLITLAPPQQRLFSTSCYNNCSNVKFQMFDGTMDVHVDISDFYDKADDNDVVAKVAVYENGMLKVFRSLVDRWNAKGFTDLGQLCISHNISTNTMTTMRMLWSWPPIREALNECGYFHGIICFHTVKKLLSSTTTPGSFFLVRCQLSVVRMRRYAFTLWVVIDENECKSIDIHFRKSMGFYIGDLINEAYYACEDDDNDLVNAEVKWLPTLFALIDSMTSPKGLFDCTGWYKQEEDGQPVPLQLQLTTPIYRPSRRCPSLQFSCVKAINRIVRYGGGGDVEKTYGEVPPHIREMLSVYPCTV